MGGSQHTPQPDRPKRILVTGSRDWDDRQAIADALVAEYEPGAVLVHGDCRGADRIAADLWRGIGGSDEPHPADWRRHSKRAGFVRNAEMVAAGADVCLAFIRNGSKGATMCADLAEEAGVRVRRLAPSEVPLPENEQ